MIQVVIPTYVPHIRHNNRLLESINKYSGHSGVEINFIISKYDAPAYQHMLIKAPNVRVITISDIVRVIENEKIDENRLLIKLKKFNYQSIKKIYGALFAAREFGADDVIVFDSENVLVRTCNFDGVLDRLIRKNTVLVDEVRGYGVQIDINKNVSHVLGKPVNFWGAVQSHWVYNKEIMERLFSEVPIFEALTNGPSIFESVLYNAYAYGNSDLKFVNQRLVLQAHMPTRFFENLRNRQTTVEYPVWGLDQDDELLDSYISFLHDREEPLVNLCNADYYTGNRIVSESKVLLTTYMGNP